MRETQAPAGYALNDAVYTVTVTAEDDGTFISLEAPVEDAAKSGSITLTGTKAVEGGDLEEGEYAFQLLDDTGAVLQTVANAADGTIAFAPIDYGPKDLGYKNYQVVEVIGDADGVNYDRHAEKVTVMISDNGGTSLDCTAVYDDEQGIAFTNKENAKKYAVTFNKRILNRADFVAGASLRVRDLSGRILDEWTSEDQGHQIQLYPGTYYLAETQAPAGYAKADDICFIVNEDGSLTSDTLGAAEGSDLTMADRLRDSTSFSFKKTSPDGTGLAGAVFRLTGKDSQGNEITATALSGQDGTVTFQGLTGGDYSLTELTAPDGFEKSGQTWNVKLDYQSQTAATSNVNSDGSLQTKNGRLVPYPNNADQTKTVTLAGAQKLHVDLTYGIEAGYDYLYLEDADGQVITEDAQGRPIGDAKGGITGGTYSRLKEAAFDIPGDTVTFHFVSDQYSNDYGYHAIVSATGLTLTDQDGQAIEAADGIYAFSNQAAKTSIPVEKRWLGDKESQRPESIQAILLQTVDGKTSQAAKLDLTADNGWKAVFDDLPLVDASGRAIAYSLEEAAVSGYTSQVTGDAESGFVITNTKDKPDNPGGGGGGSRPHTTSLMVKVDKVWQGDDPADRPESVTVDLYRSASGQTQKVRTAQLTAKDGWATTFSQLPAKDADGKTITYSIQEEPVAGYTASISGSQTQGYTLTNTKTHQEAGKVAIPVTKVWQGKAADACTVRLLADGKDTGKSLTLTAAKNWQGAFSELAKTDQAGRTIVYTVAEDALAGYTSSVSGSAETGFTLTNTAGPDQPSQGGDQPGTSTEIGGKGSGDSGLTDDKGGKGGSGDSGKTTGSDKAAATGDYAAIGLMLVLVLSGGFLIAALRRRKEDR